MRFNRTVFWQVFLTLTIIESLLALTGCTSTWITAIGALLPSLAAVVNAIVAFAAALQGKTVSPAFLAAVQKWQQNVATEITNAEAIIAALKQSASASVISQLQVVMQSVLSQFQSILNGLDVTDASTIAKLTQFVGLGIAAVNAILALLPLAMQKLAANPSAEELKHYDKLGASLTTQAENTMKETYVAIITEHTASADVNTALDALPRSI
jgi:hypothetical protein